MNGSRCGCECDTLVAAGGCKFASVDSGDTLGIGDNRGLCADEEAGDGREARRDFEKNGNCGPAIKDFFGAEDEGGAAGAAVARDTLGIGDDRRLGANEVDVLDDGLEA
jgi:hypothetical protein